MFGEEVQQAEISQVIWVRTVSTWRVARLAMSCDIKAWPMPVRAWPGSTPMVSMTAGRIGRRTVLT